MSTAQALDNFARRSAMARHNFSDSITHGPAMKKGLGGLGDLEDEWEAYLKKGATAFFM
jgi:hypothetical protein